MKIRARSGDLLRGVLLCESHLDVSALLEVNAVDKAHAVRFQGHDDGRSVCAAGSLRSDGQSKILNRKDHKGIAKIAKRRSWFESYEDSCAPWRPSARCSLM